MKYAIKEEELLDLLKNHISIIQTRVANAYRTKYMNYVEVAASRFRENNLSLKYEDKISEELQEKLALINHGKMKESELTKDEKASLERVSELIMKIGDGIENGDINIFFFDKEEINTMFSVTEVDKDLFCEGIGSLEEIMYNGKEESV